MFPHNHHHNNRPHHPPGPNPVHRPHQPPPPPHPHPHPPVHAVPHPPPPNPHPHPHPHPTPPPPVATVHHVSHTNLSPPPVSITVHHVSHQSGGSAAASNKSIVKVVSKADPNYCLTIRGGKVILAYSNPSDEYQRWYKDLKYSTRVKDEEGYPAFSLVNKVTGEAIKHSVGDTHPVQLTHYNPDVLDGSVLWTESKDLGDGHRAIRMVNNIRLNVDAYHGDKRSGGVRDGTPIVLWQWNNGDNQHWKIVPNSTSFHNPPLQKFILATNLAPKHHHHCRAVAATTTTTTVVYLGNYLAVWDRASQAKEKCHQNCCVVVELVTAITAAAMVVVIAVVMVVRDNNGGEIGGGSLGGITSKICPLWLIGMLTPLRVHHTRLASRVCFCLTNLLLMRHKLIKTRHARKRYPHPYKACFVSLSNRCETLQRS
ncbi:hypothetical protein PIB30_006087 [Stylosanthes scabra]|uniref:Hydroxyproline-rich glycoprotein family protein n=1 Tax=Stylosanthes scabra TaxID=79078 RepID=A0ABU6V318_9FABA|nr:hypothetical protein [Stylosanthes scabra]